MGGVTGALQQQADKIYNQFNKDERKAAEKIFIKLIGLERKEPVSKRADITSFDKNETQKVLSALIDNRLLVTKREDGKATVEVAHEALLRSWKVLQDLIRENEEIIILGNRLSADAKQWDELRNKDSQKANNELWSGSKLVRIIELKKEQSLPNLDDDDIAKEFIKASETQAERQKNEKIRTARTITAGSLVAVVISSGLGLIAWNQNKQAELNRAKSLGQYSLSLLNENKDLEAFVTAIKAGKILQKQNRTDSDVMAALLQVVYGAIEHNRWSDIKVISLNPNDKILALVSVNDKSIIKLMSIDGQLLKTFFAGSKVEDLSWSRDGKTLLSSSVSINDKTIIKLWRIDGQLLKTFSIINENSEYIWHTLSPDGNILARTDINNYLTGISLWNKDGNLLKNWLGNANIIYVGSWSPDGKILAVGNKDAKIQFWSREGNLLKTLPSPINLNGGGFGSTTGAIFQLAWSPDGEVLAASGTDQTIQIWNRDGELIVNLPGHATYVNSLSWSKNINGQDFGRQRSGNYSYEDFTLVSSSNDGIINLWQFSDSEIGSGWGWKLFQTIKTTSGVITVDSSSDGKNLISLTNDGILHIWDMGGIALSTTEQVVRHTDEDKKKLEPNTLTTILSPNRKILASISVSDDFTTKVELQSLDKQSLHKDISAKSVNYGNSSISSVVWSPDSKTLAFLQDKILINTIYQEIVIWDIEGGTSKIIPLKRFIRKSNPKINWSPNSKTIYFDNGSQRLKFSLELNNLLINGCSWIHKYLKNNPSVEESDRHLCDDVKK